MVTLASLWLPILVAAVLVFFASFLLHMVLPFHRSDYRPVPSEDAVMDAMRAFGIAPGDYMLPCPRPPQHHRAPEFVAKVKKGPVMMMTVMRPGDMAMGGRLAAWFVFCIVVGILSAYVTSRALPAGAPYLEVFRFSGTRGVHWLLRRAVGEHHLVQPAVDEDSQGHDRRVDLRTPHRRGVRLAVAVGNQGTSHKAQITNHRCITS